MEPIKLLLFINIVNFRTYLHDLFVQFNLNRFIISTVEMVALNNHSKKMFEDTFLLLFPQLALIEKQFYIISLLLSNKIAELGLYRLPLKIQC